MRGNASAARGRFQRAGQYGGSDHPCRDSGFVQQLVEPESPVFLSSNLSGLFLVAGDRCGPVNSDVRRFSRIRGRKGYNERNRLQYPFYSKTLPPGGTREGVLDVPYPTKGRQC